MLTQVVLVFLDRSYESKIEVILGREYWARWHYDMGEWERFLQQEHRRNRRMLGRAAVVLVVAILVEVALSGTADLGLDKPGLLYLLVLGATRLFALAYNVGSWSLYARRRDRKGL